MTFTVTLSNAISRIQLCIVQYLEIFHPTQSVTRLPVDSWASCRPTICKVTRSRSQAPVDIQWRIRGFVGFGRTPPPHRASHHSKKSPCIMLSWQTRVLLSFAVYTCVVAEDRSAGILRPHPPPILGFCPSIPLDASFSRPTAEPLFPHSGSAPDMGKVHATVNSLSR